ncbi:MAG TPA: HEPN domain-containing protein [Anaerolineales bacterium]|nr:HEPN domain-containing protein [Anaerolineales bacterium]
MSQSKSHHEAERWWFTAQDDLDAAKILHKAGKYSHACFLSHQSAEKAIKALWFSIDSDPWGHSIQKPVMKFPRQSMFQTIKTGMTMQHFWTSFTFPRAIQMDCQT